ncbi:MAG: T9SS type A sorting domain-containing protein [Lentimicrobium sp.]|nr:T9SS type A sorting domain-containing protein [Lentimicrobium sp.]
MKKLSLLTLLITFTLLSYSQSQRMVLLEEFTQASCGPCVIPNQTMHTLLEANPDKITSIFYHTSWPGTDPMNAHNPTDVSAKVSYYGFNSVPHSQLDGNLYGGHPNGWNINTVNARYAVPSPLSLSINQQLSAGNDTLFVTMLVQATADISGPMSAYMAVIEKYIHFNSPPGSNGEKDFYNVMKKLLPTKTGIALPTPMYSGEYVILESYWALANVYNISELSIVGFVQNPTSKEMLQSANLLEEPITAPHTNDVELTAFNNMIDKYCRTSFSPKFDIRNNGNTPITSLAIKYQVNDGEVLNYNWTGNLAFLEKSEIELPAVDFDLLGENQLNVYVDQINQVADDYHKNDTLTHHFTPALLTTRDIQVKIRTDNSPEEVSWDIRNSAGEVVFEGGPYTTPNLVHTHETVLPLDDCYEFKVYDAGGNGLCCTNGTGFYSLKSGSQTIAQGTQFGSEVAAQFDVLSVGVNELPANTEFEVYPNPVNGQLFIEFAARNNPKTKVNVINQQGQVVYTNEITTASEKNQKIELNTKSWPAGIYMINLDNGNRIVTRKLSVIK